MAAPAKSTPRDAQVMAAILKDMGVSEYEPRLINLMLEFVYRYVTDVLDDAKVYSSHGNKKNIDVEDVKLAIQCRMDQSFTSPPPRDLLMEISKDKNGQVLPLIKPYSGLRLPPDRYCLSAPNYRMTGHRASKKHHSRIQIGLPVNQYAGSGPKINIAQMSHGITGGKMGISGSSNPTLTVVTKNMTIPSVTIVTKSSTPSTNVIPKPSIRISTGNTPATSPSVGSSSSISSVNALQGQSSIQIQPVSQSTATLITNPLKRKHEDDDYDT